MSKQKTELANPKGAADPAAVIAKPTVSKEPSESFDERTKTTKFYLDSDGNQVNGSEDVPQPENIKPSIVTPEDVTPEEELPSLNGKVKAELLEIAEAEGVEGVDEKTTNDDIKEAIEANRA